MCRSYSPLFSPFPDFLVVLFVTGLRGLGAVMVQVLTIGAVFLLPSSPCEVSESVFLSLFAFLGLGTEVLIVLSPSPFLVTTLGWSSFVFASLLPLLVFTCGMDPVAGLTPPLWPMSQQFFFSPTSFLTRAFPPFFSGICRRASCRLPRSPTLFFFFLRPSFFAP